MDYHFTLGPGKTEPVSCGDCNFFCVKLSGGPLLINRPGEEPAQYEQGDRFTVQDGKMFKRLEVKNPSATVTLQVIIFAGVNRYEQQRQALIDQPTETKNVATTLAAFPGAGSTIDLPGIPTGAQIRRRWLLVSNPDSALDVQVLDATGAVICTVFYRTSAIIQDSGSLKVKNPNGAPVLASVAECWWVAQ